MFSITMAIRSSIKPMPRSAAQPQAHVIPYRQAALRPSSRRYHPADTTYRMAAYSYSAINAEGLQLAGEVHAPGSRRRAASSCACAGSWPSSMRGAPGERRGAASRTVFKKIKPKTLQIFSRQFATMIEAGLNVVSSLVILEEQTDDPYFARRDRGAARRRRGRPAALAGARRATRRSSADSTSRWSRPARRPESSTPCSTASRSRSRRRRRSSAASRAR